MHNFEETQCKRKKIINKLSLKTVYTSQLPKFSQKKKKTMGFNNFNLSKIEQEGYLLSPRSVDNLKMFKL